MNLGILDQIEKEKNPCLYIDSQAGPAFWPRSMALSSREQHHPVIQTEKGNVKKL